jgi:hypothetical protein
MRSLLISTILLILSNSIYCQNNINDTISKRIKSEAKSMVNALITKDYETYISFMHPILIEAYGGKDKVLEAFNQDMLHGAIIKSIEISDPSDTIIFRNEIQCTLKETTEMIYKEGKILTTATLIGVSIDGGNRWYFIDASSNNLNELQTHFPNLSDRLIIVPLSKPTFIKE